LARAKMQLSVFDFPSSVNQEGMDGAVGWPVFNRRILELNAAGAKFRFLRKVPREALAWTKLRVQTVNGVLALEVPDGARSNGIIFVDTGSPWGVDLSPEKWGEWKAAHPNEPTTLTRNYNPQTGWFVREQAWSDRVSLGPLELTNVDGVNRRQPLKTRAAVAKTPVANLVCNGIEHVFVADCA